MRRKILFLLLFPLLFSALSAQEYIEHKFNIDGYTAEMLKPGKEADVLLYSEDAFFGAAGVVTILQKVPILNVSSNNGLNTVTLRAAAEDIGFLKDIIKNRPVKLTLRSSADKTLRVLEPASSFKKPAGGGQRVYALFAPGAAVKQGDGIKILAGSPEEELLNEMSVYSVKNTVGGQVVYLNVTPEQAQELYLMEYKKMKFKLVADKAV